LGPTLLRIHCPGTCKSRPWRRNSVQERSAMQPETCGGGTGCKCLKLRHSHFLGTVWHHPRSFSVAGWHSQCRGCPHGDVFGWGANIPESFEHHSVIGEQKVKSLIPGLVVSVLSLIGCSETHSIWHDQVLPSGKSIRVTSFNLVWGVEHDERDANRVICEQPMSSTQIPPRVWSKRIGARFHIISSQNSSWQHHQESGIKTAIVNGLKAVGGEMEESYE